MSELIDALDLEPVVVKLMCPEPGPQVMTLADADQRIALYRAFLKLCAWYPVSPRPLQSDRPGLAHAHPRHRQVRRRLRRRVRRPADHFPYLGMRGPDDVTAWHAAYDRTRDLFRAHFGIDLPAGQAAGTCHNGGSSCKAGGSSAPTRNARNPPSPHHLPRPRPDRQPAPSRPDRPPSPCAGRPARPHGADGQPRLPLTCLTPVSPAASPCPGQQARYVTRIPPPRPYLTARRPGRPTRICPGGCDPQQITP